MKKLLFAALAAISLLTACNFHKNNDKEQKYPESPDSMRVALADQDSLISLMTEIAQGMSQIKQLEGIVSQPSTGDVPDQRQNLRQDMQDILNAIEQRKKKLDDLEQKLQKSGYNTNILKKAVETLKAQIAEQEATIANLKEQLTLANERIDQLNSDVDSLSTQVATVSAEKAEAQAEAQQAIDELNTCYYAIGSTAELKNAHIIETGFLKKTKIMPDDFQASYFTKADKRNLSIIQLHAKKAKLITNHPADSYVLTENAYGAKVLKITDPSRFWSITSFLVVQTN